jgi:hypothetical protein
MKNGLLTNEEMWRKGKEVDELKKEIKLRRGVERIK